MTYPGSYHPPIERRIHRIREHNGDALPPWEIKRQQNGITIQCWIPGAKREDVELTIRNHVLYLSVHSVIPPSDHGAFSSIRYRQEIPLPSDADPTWLSAEFHRGLLTLHLPINNSNFLPGELKVVVY